MLGRTRRLAVLAEGCFTLLEAKTAAGVLRYRAAEVAAVIDATRAGRTAQDCIGAGGATPVVAGLEEAAARGADALLIGIAPQGGALPEPWRTMIRESLGRGWDVLSGLHVFLGDDPEWAALARRHGGRIHDLRRPPGELRVATGLAAAAPGLRVLTVGSDCNVGKMTAALELVGELERRAVGVAFVATGQTGILIADRGVAVDALPADFVAGAVEAMVVEAATEAEVVVVEGQGALHHPGYSGVTLGLHQGACPQAMVLCHQGGRDHIRLSVARGEGPPLASLTELRRAYESAAGWLAPGRVVAVSINTSGMSEREARGAVERAAAELDLPATDPVRYGPAPLAEAVIRELEGLRAQGRR
jgi:uncharacterized NAD-dependent epimerase/dehydratase family protein